MRALARGFLGTRGRTCRHISDRFSARFEEDDEPSLAPKRPQKSATEQGSRYLEDVTNTRLRRLANHSRTKALFDSPTEDHRKFPDKGSRFRVDASVFDESLHMQATQLEKLIKEGRKEREDTRQEHLRRAAKEKDLRARQGEVIREVRRPSVENIKSCSSGPPPADEQTSTTPSETKGAADEAKAAAAAATELAKQELSTEEETGCSQDNTVADESNLQQEVLSPRQLMARVGLVRPDSTRTGAMPTTPDIEKIVNSVAVLSRRKASQDREKLAGLLAQLEPELSRLTPSLCASVLVALPWVPQWTPQLLKRLAHQANALNTLTLATTLHGLGRLQKLAILQSFHNPEAIATCEVRLPAAESAVRCGCGHVVGIVYL
ncbi:unnamed protein product [Durusdinium trenchii]|uniref:Uncharacterized protein n=1 Tax=Durusdinium trenchii TaxID=1381693 RepID=A0ABP0PU05_9DINO